LATNGKLLIHPAQIEPVHLAFSPSVEEISYAQARARGFATGISQGGGVCIVGWQNG